MAPEAVSASDIEACHRPGRLQWPAELLEEKALHIRRDIITLLCKSQTGHSGGPLSSIPRFAFSGTLAAGARLVVYGKNAYDWERATGHPAFGLSLANSGDSVLLWQIAGSETLLVDQYAYRSHEAAADRGIGRLPDGSGEWALFDGLNPYTGSTPPQGNGCNPSPNATNVCGSTPARSLTWGSVKSMYR